MRPPQLGARDALSREVPPLSSRRMPLPVTVVIPTYDRADLLRDALAGVAAQRPEPPAEVLVVDDCSTEDVGRVAAEFGAKVIRHEVNRGEAAADNTGAREATQPWLAFLDSDDMWLPHCLDTLWPHRHEHVLVSGKSVAFGTGPSVGQVGLPATKGPYLLDSPAALIFPGNIVASSGVLVRRDAVLEAGGFNTDLRDAVDLDLWLRVLERGTGTVLPSVVVRYRVHAGQASHDREKTIRAHERVLLSYAERPWFSAQLLESWRAVVAWDEARRALAVRRYGEAARQGRWLVARPARMRALARLLGIRHRRRRRPAELPAETAAPGTG